MFEFGASHNGFLKAYARNQADELKKLTSDVTIPEAAKVAASA